MLQSSRTQRGSAMVFALMCVVLVGALAAATFNRTTFTESRAGAAKTKDRAQLAADAAMQLALRNVQRVGSADSNETNSNCSVLDGPRITPNNYTDCFVAAGTSASTDPSQSPSVLAPPPTAASPKGFVNGADATDGSYNFTVRCVTANCVDNATTTNVDERLVRQITAYGYHNGKVAKRTLTFTIVPRVYRFAVFADGTSALGTQISAGGRLLLPPVYKGPTGSRGGDLGSNNPMIFASGSGTTGALVNYRATNTNLYDKYFLPSGASASTDPTIFYGGRAWGYIEHTDRNVTNGMVQYPSGTNAETSSPAFPTPSGSSSLLNFNGNAVLLSTQTALPVYTNILTDLRALPSKLANSSYGYTAAEMTTLQTDFNSFAGTDAIGQTYTPASFQAFIDSASASNSHILHGPTYIDNRTGTTACTITLSNALKIAYGSLIIHGCNLQVASTGSLIVTHNLAKPGSNTNEWPAVMLLRNNADIGGSMTVSSTMTGPGNATANYTYLQGLLFADGDVTINAAGDITGGTGDVRANFNVNGSVVTGGQFRVAPASSTATALVQWNPLVQRTMVDPSNNNLGTYSIRTADKPPPAVPIVTLDSSSWTVGGLQTNGSGSWVSTSNYFAPTWTIVGEADTVQCQLTSSRNDSPMARVTDCTSPPGSSFTGLTPYTTYDFIVTVCNSSGCSSDDHQWQYNPPSPRVDITSAPTGSLSCDSFSTCTSPNQPGEQDSTFTWATTASSVVQTSAACLAAGGSAANCNGMQCKMDSGSWANCGTINANGSTTGNTITYSNLSRDVTHVFTVRVCNVTGCYQAQNTWRILAKKPVITWTQTAVNNPANGTNTNYNVDGINSTPTANPTYVGTAVNTADTFTWTNSTDAAATTQCSIDGGAYGSCTSGTTWTAPSVLTCAAHTVSVKLINTGGTTIRSYTWDRSCPAPTVSLTGPAANVAWSSNFTPTFTWSNAGVAESRQCKIVPSAGTGTSVNGGNYFNCSSGYTSPALKSCNNYTFYVQVANTDTNDTKSATWHQNCYVSLSPSNTDPNAWPGNYRAYGGVPFDGTYHDGSYYSAYSFGGTDGGSTGGSGFCAISWSPTFSGGDNGFVGCGQWQFLRGWGNGKPYGSHTLTASAVNGVDLAGASYSDTWQREDTTFADGQFNAGVSAYWNWDADAYGIQDTSYGWSGVGVWLGTEHNARWSYFWAKSSAFNRGDDLRYVFLRDWYGSKLSILDVQYAVYTGSSWAVMQEATDGNFYSNDGNWRWGRMVGTSYLGFSVYPTFYARTGNDAWQCGAGKSAVPSRGGCGARWDYVGGAGERTYSDDNPNVGVNGETNQ